MSDHKLSEDDREYYTVVFKGDVRSMAENLFQIVSPFGEVTAIGTGNAFRQCDELEAQIAGRSALSSGESA